MGDGELKPLRQARPLLRPRLGGERSPGRLLVGWDVPLPRATARVSPTALPLLVTRGKQVGRRQVTCGDPVLLLAVTGMIESAAAATIRESRLRAQVRLVRFGTG